MTFEIGKALEVLERTPTVLESLLGGLSKDWLKHNEGEGTWSPYDVVGHLIHGEKTDWMTRAEIILSDRESKLFEPFDRFAQNKADQDRPIEALLSEFKEQRTANLNTLKKLKVDQEKLTRKGVHPEFGEVTLQELLSTWAVHDLGHICQITRVMAKQYETEVGPWKAYLGILKG